MDSYKTLTGVICLGVALVATQQVKTEEVEVRGNAYTLACGGNYSTSQASNWVLRNFNESAPVTITRMRFFRCPRRADL